VGIANLEQRHRGKKICRETRERRDKEKKTKKNGSLLTFFGKQPNIISVPSNVWPSAPVYGRKLPTAGPAASVASSAICPLDTAIEPVVSQRNLIEKLSELIENLPESIPEASVYDRLAIFAGNPVEYDDISLSPDDLWEATLNGLFKSALGWGTEVDMDEVIRRGRKGLQGLVNFVKYFVVKRGVSIGLFEGKLAHLMAELEKK
jgi:hypothetical protein